VAFDVKYITKDILNDLNQQARSISKQCTGLIGYLENYSPPGDRVEESASNDFLTMLTQYHEKN